MAGILCSFEPSAAGSGIPTVIVYLNGLQLGKKMYIFTSIVLDIAYCASVGTIVLLIQSKGHLLSGAVYTLQNDYYVHDLSVCVCVCGIDDRMSLKVLVVKVLAMCLSVSSGLALGKEGPMIHAGSIIGTCDCYTLHIEEAYC